MKIIHLISGGDSGGAKTHVFHLLRMLNQTEEAVLVCFREGPFAQEARALQIPTVVIEKNILKTYRIIKKMIIEEGFQIIHCHGSRGNMVGALLKRACNIPVVTTVHSDYQLDYMGRPFHKITYGVINTMALRFLDYRIGVSDAMVDLLISRGFRPSHLFSIYNGIDFTPTVSQMTPGEYYRSVGLSADDRSVVVGIAARLSPVKDIATLVRAFAKAMTKAPHLRLLIAGDGELKESLIALAHELGISQFVCFPGWVSDMSTFYHSIHINALTSLSETFPYALTEGAREHLPTVASRVGGVPYLIDHGRNGYLFEPGDSDALAEHLTALAQSPELRRQMGDALHEKASKEFSLEATRLRQLSIYHTILRRTERKKSAQRDGILLCGAYGRENAGDDAILDAILLELRSIDPDLPIVVLSRQPKLTRKACRVDSIYTFSFHRFLPQMKKRKLYINGGGSLIQDVTSHRSLWFYLFTLRAAKKRGCLVMMYGCGIGPIRSPYNRKKAARYIDSYVDCITLRDPHSLQELTEMNVTRPKMILSADPTVALIPSPPAQIDALFAQLGLSTHGKYICFSLRKWSGFAEKAPLFAKAAEYVYYKYGLTPVFLPIEPRIDLPASRQVTALLRIPHIILEQSFSSSDIIGIFSRMKVVLSMRLHALVFAAGRGVPVIGVSYDQKVNAFLSSIGQDLCVSLEDATTESLFRLIDIAVSRINNQAFLQEAVSKLIQLETENQLAIKRLLSSQP
ncbi:MAG: polysaccharide pyruvyl transferase CsaB [Oscillospiraceae bacterium]